MVSSDHDSELSEALSTTTIPFIIAAKSTASFKPAMYIRNIQTRGSINQAKVFRKRRQSPIPRVSNDYSPLASIPVLVIDTSDKEKK